MHDPIDDAVAAALGAGPVGVACSGGADSLVLADAAIELAPGRVVILTIDHGLHPDSAAVAARVVAWARGRGAAAVAERVVVGEGASLEAAARDARYAALDRLAERLGLPRVLLAHTARDQAETVVLRILRGTGPAGLVAIPPVRGRFVRPLLALDRAAVERRAVARALPVWDDPMNEDPRFARARVRREIMPVLRRENPQLDDALVRLARSAAEWRDAIDAIAAGFVGASHGIDCAALAGQPAAIRKRAIQLLLDRHGIAAEAVHLEVLDGLVGAPSRGEVRCDLPGGRVVRTYDRLAVETALPTPADLVAPPGYTVRRWQPGDRMRPARLGGRSRKLSDLYIDAKVPRAVRASARVAVRSSDGTIVWAEHLGLAFGEAENCVPEPTQMGGSF